MKKKRLAGKRGVIMMDRQNGPEGNGGQSQRSRMERKMKRTVFEEKKRAKGLLWILLAVVFLTALWEVDRGYSEMMDKPGALLPKVRRLDQETVRVSGLGLSVEIETGDRNGERKG